MVWDTAGYSIQWICCKMARYRDTAGYQGDTVSTQAGGRIQPGEIQTGDPKNTRQGRARPGPKQGVARCQPTPHLRLSPTYSLTGTKTKTNRNFLYCIIYYKLL